MTTTTHIIGTALLIGGLIVWVLFFEHNFEGTGFWLRLVLSIGMIFGGGYLMNQHEFIATLVILFGILVIPPIFRE
jgi:uncharacterized membrane protein HdeD (DUF308 family)